MPESNMEKVENGKQWVLDQAKAIADQLKLTGDFEWVPRDENLNFRLKFKQDGIQQGRLLPISEWDLRWCTAENDIQDRLTMGLRS
jgi:hypothetical protein